MASPPQILNSPVLLRTPNQFRDLADVNRWARGLLRSLELQAPGVNIGVHEGTDIVTPTTFPYTAQFTDYAILVDTSSGAHTVKLPKMTKGFLLFVKDAAGQAAVNNITINPNGAELIDGGLTFVMNVNWEAIRMLGTGIAGNEWLIF